MQKLDVLTIFNRLTYDLHTLSTGTYLQIKLVKYTVFPSLIK